MSEEIEEVEGEEEEEKSLYQASFRGVPFHVTKIDLKVGRRTVVHEYPQRDQPYVEDIGRATRKLTFTAFVVGDDYIEQVEKLIGAIEAPGAGTLVHPHLGEMKCTLEQASTITFTDSTRTASVVLNAVESGELEFPNVGTDASNQALEAADELEKSAIQEFCDSIDLSAISEWVSAALSGDLLDKLGIISSADLAAIFDKVDEIAHLASSIVSLISGGPKAIAARLMGALGLSRFASSARAWSRVAKQLKNLTKHEKLREGTKALARAKADSTVLSGTQRTVLQNRAAIETLIRQALIAQMVGVSALVGSKSDRANPVGDDAQTSESLRSTVTQSYDDIVQLRQDLLEVIDEELLMTTSDETYLALEKARVAVFEALTERADDSHRLVVVEPGEVLPALVHAYDFHDDANRDQEIAIRNGVEHEGFCSANSLKVIDG
jgi:prophage DNA circulation protein